MQKLNIEQDVKRIYNLIKILSNDYVFNNIYEVFLIDIDMHV